MSNEINTTFNKIDLDGFNNIVKELQNNKQYIITALNEKGVAASIDDTFMELANKITQIKEKEIITLPAETSNDFANTFFNTMMKSQGYDEMYETVWANYCGENGYVGALMTSLNKGTNTSIVLTGADAYYIYEEDKFYTVDENKKLVTVINGISTNLGTQSHLWDVENKNIIRTVFYLYKEGSTADGNRENIHASAFDYCRDSNIPNIQYKSNSGNVMHFHVSNPDTCNLKWNGGTTANTRCYYFYTNVENANAQWMLYNNGNILTYVNFEALKKLIKGTLISTSRVKTLDFPNLIDIAGGTLISSCNALESVNFSNLQSVSGGTLISSCNALESVNFSNLQSVSGGTLVSNCLNLKEITLPMLSELPYSEVITNPVIFDCTNNKKQNIIINVPKLKTLVNNNNKLTISKYGKIDVLDLSNIDSNINYNYTGNNFLLYDVDIKTIIFPDTINISFINGATNSNLTNTSEETTVYTKHLYSISNNIPTIIARKLNFPILESGTLGIGQSASYTNGYTKYIYLGCYGKPNDEIYLGAGGNTANNFIINVEIREGSRQIITIKTLTMDVDSIVNNIFKKLADNNFEDDGVTPAPAIKITIGSANLNRLTDEEKTIATDKNYILA